MTTTHQINADDVTQGGRVSAVEAPISAVSQTTAGLLAGGLLGAGVVAQARAIAARQEYERMLSRVQAHGSKAGITHLRARLNLLANEAIRLELEAAKHG